MAFVPRDSVRATHYYDPHLQDEARLQTGLSPGAVPFAFDAEASGSAVRRSYEVKLVAGNANRPLAEEVSELLGVPLSNCLVNERPDGEIRVKLAQDVVTHDVYIIQPTCGNSQIDINTAVLELLFIARRLKLSRAERITAVVPFFAYARQDRKTDLRGPISASAVAEMVVRSGVNHVVTLDLHSGQIQGYFGNVPVDNLQMAHEFATHLRSLPWWKPEEVVMVSPDAGGVERARKLADILCVGRIVTIVKRRVAAGQVESMQTVGDVAGFHCVIVDDMIDTGGTLVKACNLLKEMGAIRVVACTTHGIMTDPAVALVNDCDALESLVVSDSMPQAQHESACPKLVVLPIAPLLAATIHRCHHEASISSLFTSAAPVPLGRKNSKQPSSSSVTPASSPPMKVERLGEFGSQ